MKKENTRNFIDRAVVTISGGSGGNGCMSFRREKYVPKGGPDGGDGGQGGSVLFRANKHLKTLLDFIRRPTYAGDKGGDGRGKKKYGKNGLDMILEVPCGTEVWNEHHLLADLLAPGDQVLVARGGRGGRGNVHFKNSVRQAPRIAEKGEPGEHRRLLLKLKMIADVGLIGMPNAGKSTLLSRLTRAHPKIADYPFTTLAPNLGATMYHDQEIVFADIPGLIEGSHKGKGLGHEFLQHIERTNILVHLVDPIGFGGKSPKENIKIIQSELKKYSQKLSKKIEILVVNKQDLTGAEQVFKEMKRAHRRKKVLAISAVSGQGIAELLAEVVKAVKEGAAPEVVRKDEPIKISLEPEFWIEKDGPRYIVKGKNVERLVLMTNFDLPEAVKRTQHILRKMGIERSLSAKGARPGDAVVIAGNEFSFEPEKINID